MLNIRTGCWMRYGHNNKADIPTMTILPVSCDTLHGKRRLIHFSVRGDYHYYLLSFRCFIIFLLLVSSH